jgi:hypothetical protein
MTAYPKRSPLAAIRAFCVQCQGDSSQAVTGCIDVVCPFYEDRHGSALEKGRHSPVKACREYCKTNCLPEANKEEIRDCGGDTALLGPCPVFPFRLGTNPNISAGTREKLRQAAIKHNHLGLNIEAAALAHAPFKVPESTKTGPAEL